MISRDGLSEWISRPITKPFNWCVGKCYMTISPQHTKLETPFLLKSIFPPSFMKRVRPTSLQKFCKKFNGSRDPYEHIAQYHQPIYDGGHNFTLVSNSETFIALCFCCPHKHFIDAHLKFGIEHNTITKILIFKQGEKETIKGCIDLLKQYIARYPEYQLSRQEKLISCFLEGLQDSQLHMTLFTQNLRRGYLSQENPLPPLPLSSQP